MCVKKIIFTCLTFLSVFIQAFSQNVLVGGAPFITNYDKEHFNVSSNNKEIIQDQRGFLYFANDYGVLEFDGNKWAIIQIPSNHSNVRSIAIDNENTIYVGGQGDIGYLYYTEEYGVSFHSLLHLIPKEHQTFGDVSQTFVRKDQVFFHTTSAIFIYQNNEIRVIKSDALFGEAFQVKENIYIQTKEGLSVLKNDQLQLVEGGNFFKNKKISDVIPFSENRLLISCFKNGLFLWEKGTIKKFNTQPRINFPEEVINLMCLRRNGEIVLGTEKNGVYFLNSEGVLLRHLNVDNGLQHNEISALYLDMNDNLWLANNKGIDFIEVASPFSVYRPNAQTYLGIYDAIVFEDKLYLATHSGLLYASIESLNQINSGNQKFKRIENAPKVNWKFSILNNQLCVGHSQGFSQIENGEIKTNISTNGGWIIKPFPNDSTRFLAGTYDGLYILKHKNGKLEIENRIEGFKDSCRLLEFDDEGNIWMAHGYKGIFKFKLSTDYKKLDQIDFYDSTKGLPSNLYNNILKIGDDIIISSQNGLMNYDASTNSIVQNEKYNNLTEGWIGGRIIQSDEKGNIWYAKSDVSGMIQKHADGRTSKIEIPFLKLNNSYIPGFEFFRFQENGTILIGSNDGLIVYNNDQKTTYNPSFEVYLRQVKSIQNQNKVIYDDQFEALLDTVINENVVLPYSENSLQFHFTSSSFEDIEQLQYQIYLEGYDKQWSNWNEKTYKEYTNLGEGEYVFRLKAKNIYNTVSKETSFRFEVLPPWYRSIFAYFCYCILTILIVGGIAKLRALKVSKAKDKIIQAQLQKQKLEEARFKEERLQSELENKNKELSGLAMKEIYKNEKLSELKTKLSSLDGLSDTALSKKLSQVVKFIDDEMSDGNWEDFEMRFNLAHNNFIMRLKENYPELTPKDLKNCAYLRMNLSTKEIAQLLNMSVRGVETAKYRIRKRMNLNSEENLTDFLLTY